MTKTGSLHAQLRDATQTAHRRLEDGLDVLARLADPSRRVDLMRRFWGLHRGAETVLTPRLAAIPGLDYVGRSKIGRLAADIAWLTGSPPGADLPVCTVAIDSREAALGLAYVLEGSALGGRMIRREMIARGEPADGLTFFDPYGHETGARWRDFLAVLEREVATGGPVTGDRIVQGALAGFALTDAWLSGDATSRDPALDPVFVVASSARSPSESCPLA